MIRFFWLKFVLLSGVIFITSLALTMVILPLNLFLVYAIVLLDFFREQRARVASILSVGLLIDALSGEFLGFTSLFLLCYSVIFDWLKFRFLDLHKRLILLIRVGLGIVLYYLYIHFWHYIIERVSDDFWINKRFSWDLVLYLFISVLIGAVISLVYIKLIEVVFRVREH